MYIPNNNGYKAIWHLGVGSEDRNTIYYNIII